MDHEEINKMRDEMLSKSLKAVDDIFNPIIYTCFGLSIFLWLMIIIINI